MSPSDTHKKNRENMAAELLFGITESGVMHTDADPPIPLETKSQMVKESGIYDYFDKTPAKDLVDEYQRCSEKHDLPILAVSSSSSCISADDFFSLVLSLIY